MMEKHGTIEGIFQAATLTVAFAEPAKEEETRIV
jgi:hypothetical protein